MDKSPSGSGIHNGGGIRDFVCLHLQWTDWLYVLAQLYEGSNHTPLPKDKHLGILPQGRVEESPYGQISKLKVCQLLSAGPQVVYPVGLNGGDQ